jgi:hypothetical protein
MPSLIFITPVWQRYELTEICLISRRQLCDALEDHGIYATSVIIGDDDNLDIARALGFEVVERDNEFLSRKFNDGYETAFNHGFDYCYPVGSDSILTVDQFINTVGEDLPIASHYYSMIHVSGKERIDVKIEVPGGIGPLIIPVSMLQRCGSRPIQTDLRRGCDNAARQTILTQGIEILTREEHQWEHVAFQSGVTQITDYERIRRVYDAEVVEIVDGVFPEIEELYHPQIITALADYYRSGRSVNA